MDCVCVLGAAVELAPTPLLTNIVNILQKCYISRHIQLSSGLEYDFGNYCKEKRDREHMLVLRPFFPIWHNADLWALMEIYLNNYNLWIIHLFPSHLLFLLALASFFPFLPSHIEW